MPGYVLDTSIWIRVGDNHPPDIFVSLWEQFDAAIASRDVRSPEEVLHELERGAGDDLAATLRARAGLFAALDEPLQRAVAEIVARCPGYANPLRPSSESPTCPPPPELLVKLSEPVTQPHSRNHPQAIDRADQAPSAVDPP